MKFLYPLADAVIRSATDQTGTCKKISLITDCIWPYQTTAIYGAFGVESAAGDEIVAAFRVLHAAAASDAEADTIHVISYVHRRATELLAESRRSGKGFLRDVISSPEIAVLDEDQYAAMLLGFFRTIASRLGEDLPAVLLKVIASSPLSVQEELRRSPDKITVAANEAVRLTDWGVIPRTVARDCVVAGQHMSKDDKVIISLGASGRDPRVFADPQSFCPDRPDLDRQLSFGAAIIGARPGSLFA